MSASGQMSAPSSEQGVSDDCICSTGHWNCHVEVSPGQLLRL